VLYDAVYTVTGSQMKIPGVPEGTRAAALADADPELPDNFLANLGRPARESACECERSDDLQLGPVMALMNGPTVSDAISQAGNAIEELVAQYPDDTKVIEELFVRILNRPARPEEVAAARQVKDQLDEEHAELVAELRDYAEQIAPVLAEREAKRAAAIEAAKAELERYRQEIAPREAQLDKEHQDRIAKLEAELAAYDAAQLAAALENWEKDYRRRATWVTLDPSELKGTRQITLDKLPDLSVRVSGNVTSARLAYTITAETNLRRVTGVKLEALADGTLPGNGPGLAPNGNFVLTEFTANWASKQEPKKTNPIAFADAKADYHQEKFEPAKAINGDVQGREDGWAVGGQTGRDHVAVFSLKEPLTLDDAAQLTFLIDQRYQDRKHWLGRFRISLTDAESPLEFGVPREIDAILAIARGARTGDQQQQLVEWFKTVVADRRATQVNLEQARLPRPIDAGITEREARIELESQPLPEDPQLARLQRAVKLSEQQLETARLTAAQDIAWALINSPAFLFNR
jgi:hypothetical protein